MPIGAVTNIYLQHNDCLKKTKSELADFVFYELKY